MITNRSIILVSRNRKVTRESHGHWTSIFHWIINGWGCCWYSNCLWYLLMSAENSSWFWLICVFTRELEAYNIKWIMSLSNLLQYFQIYMFISKRLCFVLTIKTSMETLEIAKCIKNLKFTSKAKHYFSCSTVFLITLYCCFWYYKR